MQNDKNWKQMVEMTKTMLRCIFFYINIKITKWMYGKKDEEEIGGYESTSGKVGVFLSLSP